MTPTPTIAPGALAELLPCPFCGQDGELHNSQCDEDTHVYWVQCSDCGAVSGQLLAPSIPDEEFAVSAWNTRAVMANCTCSQTPGAACGNCPTLPPLPKVSGYDKRPDGHYSAQAMRAYAADAIAYSRNFANAKPDIGVTEKQHILGLCDALERANTPANPSAKVRSYLQEVLREIEECERPICGGGNFQTIRTQAYNFIRDHGPALAELLAAKDAAGEYPIAGQVYFRDSTNEWVLELTGTINDTNFTCRHTQPADTLPENVPGLPSMYAAPVASGEREAVEWRPIESAPTKGREQILICVPGREPQMAWADTWWRGGSSAGNTPAWWHPVTNPNDTPPSLRTGEGDSGV